MTSVTGRRPYVAVTLLVATYLCIKAYWLVSARAGRLMDHVWIEGALKLALWASLPALVLWFLSRHQDWSLSSAFGLDRSARRGLVFGLIATVPMMVAVVLLPKKAIDPDLVLGSGLLGPLAEEILFRGFLFTCLIRRAGWSMPAALVVSSVAFGLAHVRSVDSSIWAYHAWTGDLTTVVLRMIERALPYAAGGALFAWVTYRWNSLWPAIALHGLMNLWWDLTTGEHAQLAFRIDAMSAAQAISVALAIALTLRVNRSLDR